MEPSFVSITSAARCVGVPVAWLKAEAEGGRLPHLRVGRRLLFDLAAVEAELRSRSIGAVKGEWMPT